MNIKGFRTIGYAFLIGGLGAAQEADWVSAVGNENAGYVLIVIAAGIAILRKLTSTPMGKGE